MMNHFTDDDLIDYLHHELPDNRDAEIHAHLAECGACCGRYDDEAALGDILRNSSLAEERELPAYIRANVWVAVRALQPTPLERLRALVQPALVVPIAAMLAFFAYVGLPIIRGEHTSGTDSVTALYYFEEHAADAQQNPLADHVNPNLSFAPTRAAASSSAPLIDSADAATLDDVAAARD